MSWVEDKTDACLVNMCKSFETDSLAWAAVRAAIIQTVEECMERADSLGARGRIHELLTQPTKGSIEP